MHFGVLRQSAPAGALPMQREIIDYLTSSTTFITALTAAGLSLGFRPTAVSTTLTQQDFTLFVTVSNQTVTLPPAAGAAKRVYAICPYPGVVNTTVIVSGGGNVVGVTAYVISTSKEILIVQCSGSEWLRISSSFVDALPAYGLFSAKPTAAAAGERSEYWASDVNGGTSYQVQAGVWVQKTKGVTLRPPLPAPDLQNAVYKAWTLDPLLGLSTFAPNLGIVRLVKVRVTPADTISTVTCRFTAVGTALSGVYLVLYDTAGNKLGQTADLSASVAVGSVAVALQTPVVISSVTTDIYAGILVGTGTTTAPTVIGVTTQDANIGLGPASTLRVLNTGSALTAPPSTVFVTTGGGATLSNSAPVLLLS